MLSSINEIAGILLLLVVYGFFVAKGSKSFGGMRGGALSEDKKTMLTVLMAVVIGVLMLTLIKGVVNKENHAKINLAAVCNNSAHGCCPDGNTSKANAHGSNCGKHGELTRFPKNKGQPAHAGPKPLPMIGKRPQPQHHLEPPRPQLHPDPHHKYQNATNEVVVITNPHM